MTVAVEKKFAVEVTYNGVTKSIEVQPEEQVTALLHKAIAAFGITQNAHLLSLFRQDGTVVPENESAEQAGLKPDELLLLRPNTVKGGNGPLHLARSVIERTFRTLRKCGACRFECVVYWTGPADRSVIDGIEHPLHKRSQASYEVDDGWLTQLWKRLAKSKRSIKAQVHTHPQEAFHSATDDHWPIVSTPGFLSIVIPGFGCGSQTLEQTWVGRLEKNGRWQQVSSPHEVLILA